MRAAGHLVFWYIFAALSIGSCGSKGTKPDDDHPNLLLNGSFEVDGNPSLAGWAGIDSVLISLSPEAPPGGGIYCLTLGTSWLPPSSVVWALIPGVKAGEVLVLSATVRTPVWGNGGALALTVGPTPWQWPPRVHGKGLTFNNTSWSSLSVVDTVSLGPVDSVWVVLQGPACEVCIGGPAQFDLISVRRQ